MPLDKRGVLMEAPPHGSPPLGTSIAAILRGSWREAPEPLTKLDHAFSTAVRTLLETGCGALGWWRLRGSKFADHPSAAPLREAFRLHSLQAEIHARNLEHAIGSFNAAGLTPIVFKGWALARLYARPGLRPYGDVDLLVDTEDEPKARAVIAGLPPELQGFVDLDMRVLHRFLPDRSFGELAGRTSTGTIGKAAFRLLCAEDHLRLVCLHQLDHGGWRPLWLCDVAAFVESLPENFRWHVALAGNSRLSDAVIALIALAEELLGARLPPATPRNSTPRWFRKAILRAWAGGYQAPPDSLLRLHKLSFSRATAAVRARWPDPVTSTLHLRAPLRVIPRPVLQLVELARRAIIFARRTGGFAISRPTVAVISRPEKPRS